jgi:pimeloyl-ACP methyl ester carboxylesterase
MEKFFITEGKRICYSDTGSGKLILLLHGYLETSRIWENFAKRLSADFRIIAPDIPGHGGSDMFGEVHSIEMIAMLMKNLVNEAGVDRFLLAGHSLGGYAALAFAELYPEMLSGYCLFHSHPLADSPEALNKRRREIELVLKGKKDLMYPDNISKMFAEKNLERFSNEVERSKEIASSVPAEGIVAVLKGMMERKSRIDVMEKGEVPCLWILGAMDNYIDCNVIQTKVSLPRNAELKILQNSGHLGFVEEENISAEILKSFANSHN